MTITGSDQTTIFAEEKPRSSSFKRICRVLLSRIFTVIGLVVLLILVIAAIFANQLSPYDPYEQNMNEALAVPSSQHLLGTDLLGRDMLSRMIYGARTALMVGFIATGIAASAGIAMGLAGHLQLSCASWMQ
jgi:peptide/nickel transport system permease protein